jgi:hypothetical protein
MLVTGFPHFEAHRNQKKAGSSGILLFLGNQARNQLIAPSGFILSPGQLKIVLSSGVLVTPLVIIIAVESLLKGAGSSYF